MTRAMLPLSRRSRTHLGKSHDQRRQLRRRRLLIEILEDRRLLSGVSPTLVWEYDTPGAYSLAVSADGGYVAVGTSNGLHFLDEQGNSRWTYSTSNPVLDLAMPADATEIAAVVRSDSSSGGGGPVQVFDRDGNQLYTISDSHYSSVAYSPQGDYYAVTYESWTGWYDQAALWDRLSGWLWYDKTIGQSGSGSVSVSANGITATGAAMMGTTSSAVRVYGRTGSLTWTYPMSGTIGAEYSVAITADGNYVVAGNTKNANLQVLDVANKQLLWEYNTGNIQGVAVSSDGGQILAGASDAVYLFDASGSLQWATGITGIQDVALSADASLIVVATASGKVYAFDVSNDPGDTPPPATLDSFDIVDAEFNSTGVPSQRKLAVTSDGHLHTVYHRLDPAGVTQIFHAESADGGETWVEEPITSGGGNKSFPAVAVDSLDVLHLVWQDANQATYYTRKATTWQTPEWVASYATTPAIAVDGNDHVHVVYGVYVLGSGYWGGGDGIRWRVRTPAGWQAEQRVSSDRCWSRYPAIAVDGDNRVHVVWNHAPRSTYYDVHYRVRTSSGWGTEVEVNAETNNEWGAVPSIAVDSENHAHVVWGHLSEGSWAVKYREYSGVLEPTVNIVGPASYPQVGPVVSLDGGGRIHVVWHGKHENSPTTYQLRHKRYDSSWRAIANLTASEVHDQTGVNVLFANHPTDDGQRNNVLGDGCALIWMDDTTIRYGTVRDVAFPAREPGVTIITHGWQAGNATLDQPGWTLEMARAVGQRAQNASVYFHDRSFADGRSWSALPRVDDTAQWTAKWTGNSDKPSGDIVLVCDWVWESDDVIGEGPGWLQAAADNLFASLLNPPAELGLSGDALLRRPLHFIGHSRGAVLNSLVVNQIGRYDPSITVDQFTSLDPHPWAWAEDPGYESQTLQLTTNVNWADNYYRRDLAYELDLDFDGVVVPGARNLELNESKLDGLGHEGALEGNEHADVHLWYSATIDPTAGQLEEENLAEEQAAGWWTAGLGWLETSAGSGDPDSGRANVGYAYSLEGGKTRPAIPKNGWLPPDAEPLGVVNGDFEYGGSMGTEIPGWERHGGGGTGHLASDENGNSFLELDFNIVDLDKASRTHNALYVPSDAQQLVFRARVNERSLDDVFKVMVGDRVIGEFSVAQTSSEFVVRGVTIPEDLRGTVQTITFSLEAPSAMNAVDAEIQLDDVSFSAVPFEDGPNDIHGWTVIVHGLTPTSDQVPDWETELAQAIVEYADNGGSAFRYVPGTGNLELLSGTGSTVGYNALAFDWSVEADVFSSPGWAEAAGDALYATLVDIGAAVRDGADQVLQLIGYSRGASVVSEAARRLLASGYAVDQVTYLDGEDDFYGDPDFRAWETIGFVDNYYDKPPQMIGGEGPLAGAYSFEVSPAVGHSDFPAKVYLPTLNALIPGSGIPYSALAGGARPDETGLRSPLADQPPAVFNGDFEVQNTGTRFPGWDYHGGGGTGHVEEADGNRFLQLDLGDTCKTHNRMLIPADADRLLFDLWVDVAKPDSELIVYLDNDPNLKLTSIPLSNETSTFVPQRVAVPKSLRGSVHTLTFKINDGGSGTPQVNIDNVRFSVAVDADDFGVNADNQVVLALAGDNLVATVDGVTVLRTALAGLTDGLTIYGQTGNDTLVIDFSNGNPLPPGGLTFHGGDGFDTVEIVHGPFTDIVKTFSGPHDGTIQLDALPLITYTGLEPVDFIGDQVTNLTIDLPTGADNAVIEDAGVAGDGLWRIHSTDSPPSFEQTIFPSPSGSLTINANGGDTVTVTAFDSLFNTPQITLGGSGGGNRFVLSASERLPDAAAVALTGDAEFDLSGCTETIGSLSDLVGAAQVLLGTGTLVTGGNHASTTYAGTISGSGILNKTGNGVFRLAGAAGVGAATVEAGTLLINGTLTAEQDVQVHSGGTLGGTGTITASARVLVLSGATLDPGELEPSTDAPLPGRLTVDGNVRVEQGATFRVQLGGLNPGAGGYDQLTLHGTIDLGSVPATPPTANGGALSASIVGGFMVPVGATFRIIDNDETELITTRFDGLPEGDFLYPGGVLMNISYLSGLNPNDVTLTAPGRYDFNGYHGYTADGFTGVSPFQLKAGHAFGWQTLLPQYFERNWPDAPPYENEDGELKYDGQATDSMGAPLTFLVDVAAGRTYEVIILTGDAVWNHDRQQFTASGSGTDGTTAWTQVDTWGAGAPSGDAANAIWGGGTGNPGAGYYRWVRLTVDVGGAPGTVGQIAVTMEDLGGYDGTAVILGMDVRPVEAVGQIAVAPLAALPADGVTWDTYSGSGAPPHAVLTVTGFAPDTDPTSADNSHYVKIEGIVSPATAADLDVTAFGTQITSDAAGNFSFRAQRPSLTSPVNFTVEESSGLSRGTMTQAYTAAAANALRFDFGIYGSPVQEYGTPAKKFLEVIPQTTYNATRGYGWMSRVAGAWRKNSGLSNLRTDLNYARDATFKVDLPDGDYSVRIYHANPKYYGTVPYVADNFSVYFEGPVTGTPSGTVTYNVSSVPAGETVIETRTVTVTGGALEMRFVDLGGQDGNVVVSGIDISAAGQLPGAMPLLAVGDPQDGGAEAIDVEQLRSAVAEAAARWSAAGLTAAQTATLANVQYAVADLGGAYLGLASPATNQIRIDDDAAMMGWSLVTGHSSLDEGQMTNDKGQITSDGIDLLTVVMHELGHLLGYEHSADADDLMAPLLGVKDEGRSGKDEMAETRFDSSSFVLGPWSVAPDLASRRDSVFAGLGRGGGEDGVSPRVEPQDDGVPAVVTVSRSDEATQARVPRRSWLQRFERERDEWFAELAVEEASR